MKVAIEEILSIMNRLKEINDTPLRDIQWTFGEGLLEVTSDDLAEWQYTGLSNKDFAYYNIMHKLGLLNV